LPTEPRPLSSSTASLIPIAWAPAFAADAKALASRRGFPLLGERENLRAEAEPLVLWLDDAGLSLRQTGPRAMGPVRCDFVAGEVRHRRLYGGGKSQSIAKAVGIKDGLRPRVADLTAGMGGDALALAGLGCRVVLVERHPVVAALLADGLRRAREAAAIDADLAELVARITLVCRDSREWLADCGPDERPDVIYLDPMFPERRKSAQVNKSMQIFHQLVGADSDADDLLPLALDTARHRVVVKRPSHAPWLGGVKPGLCFEGKSVRFDVYPLRAMAGRRTSDV